MGGVPSGTALLVSLLAALSLLACSTEEGRRPVEEDAAERGGRAGGGGPFPRGRGGEEAPVASTGGSVAVGRAVLSSAGDADLIHARVEYRGSWIWPRCSLLEGPDAEAVRGTIERREPPRGEGFTRPLWEESLWEEHESLWADRSTIEKSLQDDGAVIWIFYENPTPDGAVADPRRTPFYVRCAGGDPPEVAHDTARVLGTPG